MKDLISEYIAKKELHLIKPQYGNGFITLGELRNIQYALKYDNAPTPTRVVNLFSYERMPDVDDGKDWNIFSRRRSGKTHYLISKAIEILLTEVGVRIVWVHDTQMMLERASRAFQDFCRGECPLDMRRNIVRYSTNNSELCFISLQDIRRHGMRLDRDPDKIVIIIDEPDAISYHHFEESIVSLLGGGFQPFRMITAGTSMNRDHDSLGTLLSYSNNLYKAEVRAPEPSLIDFRLPSI